MPLVYHSRRSERFGAAMDEDNSSQENLQLSQPDFLRNLLAVFRENADGDKDLVKQMLADFNAAERQSARNLFESRVEFARHITSLQAASLAGLKDYGLQTLKWLFLLNAGAIAIILTYLGGAGKLPGSSLSTTKPLLSALWPFAAGCIFVVAAGAASFFNFSHAEATLPSPHSLNVFLNPAAKNWPEAKMQKEGETSEGFNKRYRRKVNGWRTAAICLASCSGALFALGIVMALSAAF